VKVARLVLLNGSLLLKYYRPLLSQRLLLNRVTGPVISALRLIRRPLFARQFRRLFPKPPPEDEIDAFYSLITSNDGLRIYHRLIGYLRERAQHEDEWLAALATHPAPLLVLWGQRDPVSRPRIAEAVVEVRKQAGTDVRYVPLPALGHYPQWEDPEAIGREILSFLTEATPALPPAD
jgi:pimeloyl-ACP methyl ester carboxylesterase